jgi:hypothetical protein
VEGLPSTSTASTAVCAAIQHDVHDHTMAAPISSKVTKRVWVLPASLCFAAGVPSSSFTATATSPSSTVSSPLYFCNGTAGEGVSSTRTSTQSACAAAGCAPREGGEGNALLTPALRGTRLLLSSPSGHDRGSGDGGGVCDVDRRRLPVRLVRLPHPRHGQPTLYLVRTTHPTGPTLSQTSSSPSPSSLLFEIQAQAPQNQFAQSWFVQAEVIPSTPHNGELLIVTPVDLTYFALRELFADAAVHARLAQKFMSADDLFRSVAATHTAPPQSSSAFSADQHGCCGGARGGSDGVDHSTPGKTEGCYVSVFGGIGAGGADSESSQSSNSSPYSSSSVNTPASETWCGGYGSSLLQGMAHPTERGNPTGGFHLPSFPASSSASGKGWKSWADAAAAYPLVLHACFDTLRSSTVLRRLCEVREVGGGDSSGVADAYYRPSEAVAVEWLRRKVMLLRGSTTLREVLQLPEQVKTDAVPPTDVSVTTSSSRTSSSPQTGTRQSSDGPISAAASAEVPLSIAFGMIAEYVPERLHGPLAVACGLPDPALAASTAVSSLSPSTTTGGVRRDRDGGGARRPEPASDTTSPASTGPKSASVKRLEKAGRPKGTPTLLSMFAKKQKTEGDGG